MMCSADGTLVKQKLRGNKVKAGSQEKRLAGQSRANLWRRMLIKGVMALRRGGLIGAL